MVSDLSHVIYEVKDRVAWVTLNHPEKLNALSTELCDALKEALEDTKDNPEVNVVVLRANGRAFSSGYNLGGGGSGRRSYIPEAMAGPYRRERIAGWMSLIWDNPKPVIAQVHGYCLAGAGDLVGMCDITIASEDAKFGYPILPVNAVAPVTLWPWLIGFKLTKELCLTGRLMGAEEALGCNLINRVVPRDQLDEVVQRYAAVLANAATRTWVKKAINDVFSMGLGVDAGLKHLSQDMWPAGDTDPVHLEFRRRTREDGVKLAVRWREQMFNINV